MYRLNTISSYISCYIIKMYNFIYDFYVKSLEKVYKNERSIWTDDRKIRSFFDNTGIYERLFKRDKLEFTACTMLSTANCRRFLHIPIHSGHFIQRRTNLALYHQQRASQLVEHLHNGSNCFQLIWDRIWATLDYSQQLLLRVIKIKKTISVLLFRNELTF